MTERLLRVEVPDGEEIVAAVAVRVREDGMFAVQEYRQSENISGRNMARVLLELATTLEFEERYNEDD